MATKFLPLPKQLAPRSQSPFSARISIKRLAGLSRRLATALQAGIDARTVWAREADRAAGRARRPLRAVSDAVRRGDTTAEALAAAGSFFPPLFCELAQVGELTGHQGEVFAQLAEHYDGQVALRRQFLASITWPLAQLAITVVIVGFLIWIMGVIGEMTGNRLDPLGFGLVGNCGLAIYAAFLAAVGLASWLIVRAVRSGMVWTRPIQRAVLRIPVLGKALQTTALARLAWTLHLTLKAGMDVRQALRLSLQSARNARYTDQIAGIDAEIARGNSVYEAFCCAGRYPSDFLDALAVGEQTGRIVESMETLSRQYQQQARAALATLTTLAGFAVWAAIATIIIALIFRLFSFYLGAINQAANM